MESAQAASVPPYSLLSEPRGIGFTVDGADALDIAGRLLATRKYDVCLLDERVGSATDLLRAAAIERNSTPIIVLAEEDDRPIDVGEIGLGVVDCLSRTGLGLPLLRRAIHYAVGNVSPAELADEATAHFDARQALRLSEQRYAGVVANVPGMIYRAARHSDGAIEFVYVSEGCRELFGVGPEQFKADGATLARMVHPDDRNGYEQAGSIAGAVAQPWQWQGRFILPSGEEKVILGKGSPSQLDGELIWDGLLTDVSDRVQAERQAAQLAAIVEGSLDAIMGTALDGVVTNWNPAAEDLYGYSSTEIVGLSVSRLLPGDRSAESSALLGRVAAGEKVDRYETLHRAADGNLIDVALTISPVHDREGRVVGASMIAHDIRRKKLADAQIHRQMSRIQALRNVDMAIAASLDLRLTLNVILDQVTTHLQVDGACILLLNEHTRTLEFAAGRGFTSAAIERTSLRIGEGVAGRAALERRMVNVPDLREIGAEFVRTKLVTSENFVSYWVVPLISKGRVEGVLEVYDRAFFEGDADWLGFLETLAGQAAIAVENAALFNDLQRSNIDLQIAYDSTLEGWSKALDLRDKETEGHTRRVTDSTMKLAKILSIPADEVVQMRRGALLHDIGKMGIPDSILLKPAALTDTEWVIMKKHPVYAYEMLAPIPYLRPALDIPYCHHERWDGSGYPRGLRGEQIPLSARIFAAVDVWDALRSDRPYRQAWSAAKVREYIAGASGSHFDPSVVEVLLDTEFT